MAEHPRSAKATALQGEIAKLRQQVGEIRGALDRLLVRQIVPMADGVLAIRHQLGWLFVPQEDFAAVLHLSDGISGHEIGTMLAMRELVRPGDTVIDIGAHIGLHAIPLARAVGNTGRLIAVEPVPRTADCLRKALISNGLIDRCDLIVGAASDHSGTIDFYLGSNSMLGSLLPEVDDQASIEVREVCLDDWLPADRPVSLIKMDVEGAELTVLSGLRRIIADNPGLVLLAELGPSHLERVGVEIEDWFDHFTDAGLTERFVIDEQSGRLSKVDMAEMHKVFSVNILFARDSARVEPLLAG